MEYTIPDTLVLKIEENDKYGVDTILYILFDILNSTYIIRGKRNEDTSKSCAYSFECESQYDLINFIEFLVDKNRVNYVLYNYDNLPAKSNEITYEFLEIYDDNEYEIGGYDNKKLNRKELYKILSFIRRIYNNNM
jgi:hypothetical protein